jgi:hypothetical protein
LTFVFDQTVDDQGLTDNSRNTHARIQGAGGILENDLHLPPKRLEAGAAGGDDICSFKAHLARSGRNQLEDGAAHGGLAAAGLPYQAQGFALSDIEAHAIDRPDMSGDTLQQAGSNREMSVQIHHAHKRSLGCGRSRCGGGSGGRGHEGSMVSHFARYGGNHPMQTPQVLDPRR